jgi:hypothetical protein
MHPRSFIKLTAAADPKKKARDVHMASIARSRISCYDKIRKALDLNITKYNN